MVKDCQFGVSPVNYSDSDSDHWCSVGTGKSNPRVNHSSRKRGFAEFPTGMVDPRVWISWFLCTTMIDSISHISNKNIFILAGHCGLPLATYCKVHHT